MATPFHSNRVERRRHDAPCAGAHTCALKPHRTARPARRARACRLREPHRGLGRLFVRKGTRWPNLFIRTAWSGEGMTPHAQEPAPSSRTAQCTVSAARPGAHAHHPFRVASISGEKQILHAKTSAPPQRSVRAGTVGGIRPRQVPWMRHESTFADPRVNLDWSWSWSWSPLFKHHLHRRHGSTFADPAGCSAYGALHATCKDEAPRTGAHKQPRPET